MYLHRCSSSDQHWLVSNCWQYIFYRPSGYHLFTSFIHFPIISLASELGGKSRRHEKETNNTDYERTTDHGGERGDTCLEIRFRMHPSLFVCASLRPCHPLSIAYAPYCPFVSVQCIQTNTHKADYRLEVKDRER